jgi:hypothetical protein
MKNGPEKMRKSLQLLPAVYASDWDYSAQGGLRFETPLAKR